MPAFFSPLQIGAVVRNARVFDFKLHQHAMPENESQQMEGLLQTVAQLFALLEARRVDYLLVGGVAILQYVEGRNTQDIDLILATEDLAALPEIKIISTDADFARGDFQGLQVNMLLSRNRLFRKVQKQYATRRAFQEREIPCASVEGLLLLKLYALPALYRLGNFARVGLVENDIAILMHDYRPNLKPLWKELARYLNEVDLKATQEIVVEIQARIDRFDKTVARH